MIQVSYLDPNSNQQGLLYANQAKDMLRAIRTLYAGNTGPTATLEYMFWVDTSSVPNMLKMRNSVASTTWHDLFPVDASLSDYLRSQSIAIGGLGGEARLPTGNSLNTVVDTGVYRIDGSTTGNTYGTGLLIHSNRESNNATQVIVSQTDNQVYVRHTIDNGSNWTVRPILPVATTTATLTGASVTIDNIPSWVRRITISCLNVSTSDGSIDQSALIQLGTSASFATSGYVGGMTNITASLSIGAHNRTTGFCFWSNGSYQASGQIFLANHSGTIWTASGALSVHDGALNTSTMAGRVDAGGAVTRLRFTTAGGTATYDSGTVTLFYE